MASEDTQRLVSTTTIVNKDKCVNGAVQEWEYNADEDCKWDTYVSLMAHNKSRLAWVHFKTAAALNHVCETDMIRRVNVYTYISKVFYVAAEHGRTKVWRDEEGKPAVWVYHLGLRMRNFDNGSDPSELFGILLPNRAYGDKRYSNVPPFVFKFASGEELSQGNTPVCREIANVAKPLTTATLPHEVYFRDLARRVDHTLSSFAFDPTLVVYEQRTNRWHMNGQVERLIEARMFPGLTKDNYEMSMNYSVYKAKQSPFLAAPRWDALRQCSQVMLPLISVLDVSDKSSEGDESKSSASSEHCSYETCLAGAIVMSTEDTDKEVPHYRVRKLFVPSAVLPEALVCTRAPQDWIITLAKNAIRGRKDADE